MAVLSASHVVAVEDYLNSSYRPKMEYVDGVLVERGMPTIAHGVLQKLVLRYFDKYEAALGFLALPEVRTQIIERARYRAPDVMLCTVPLPAGKIVSSVLWAVIEILSPNDKTLVQLERFRVYARIGVQHIVLLDPENWLAFRFQDGSLLQAHFTSLDLPTGVVPFDSEALFQELVALRNSGRE